ncbi:hypothetical protein FIBSPDRAFT_872356 [Athelia psychrophila]|uniref:Uncharacterized protein n=1 Tax=Athelia psychrophila TaxID=1759441 RepID=A0A165ZJP5_9AGAM|nr:hypothetical protein FIBSPDRAFT_872356 [Fibularhizoctonia sp. CBS 109695]
MPDSCRLKALLFALIRAFEFELAVLGSDVKGSARTVVQRPFVTSEPEKGCSYL